MSPSFLLFRCQPALGTAASSKCEAHKRMRVSVDAFPQLVRRVSVSTLCLGSEILLLRVATSRSESHNESAENTFGKDVVNFLCPIDLKNKKGVSLCEGHILNRAIPVVSRKTVVQYADIDSFYGSAIEPAHLLSCPSRSPWR